MLRVHCASTAGCSPRFATRSLYYPEYHFSLDLSDNVILRSLGGRSLVHFLFCFITLSCWSLLRTQRLSRHPHRPLLRALLRYLRVIPSPWPNYWSYTNRFVNFFKTNVSWYERFGRIEYQLPFLSLCENRRTKKWEKTWTFLQNQHEFKQVKNLCNQNITKCLRPNWRIDTQLKCSWLWDRKQV